MINIDKTSKLILIWIALMLTIIAAKELLQAPILMAQDSSVETQKIVLEQPIEVVIKEPVKIDIARWSAFPSQSFKVKIDEPWPAKIEVTDEVKVSGELKLRD